MSRWETITGSSRVLTPADVATDALPHWMIGHREIRLEALTSGQMRLGFRYICTPGPWEDLEFRRALNKATHQMTEKGAS